MNLRSVTLLFVFNLTLLIAAIGQPAANRISREDYISRYKEAAIIDFKKYGVPSSIKLAQAVLESDNGNSRLARDANNHFGIKCHSTWNGPGVYMDDDEKNECFRKYKSVLESYYDHSEFLKGRPRYAFLFELDPYDYKAWAHGLKQAGYATNPKYPQLLIQIIEDNKLYQYDVAGVKPSLPVASSGKPSRTHRPSRDVEVSIDGPMEQVFETNGVKYIKARSGETYASAANRHDMMSWQILKYNEIDKDYRFREGESIYIKPKRNKASKDIHVVQAGESMHDIAQKYAVKERKLYDYNGLSAGTAVPPGTRVYLRSKKK